jgi:hypothetical protein
VRENIKKERSKRLNREKKIKKDFFREEKEEEGE